MVGADSDTAETYLHGIASALSSFSYRCAWQPPTDREPFLPRAQQEVDRRARIETLDEIMERVEGFKAALKTGGAKVAEKPGRLKPNSEWLDYSPSSRVLEGEGARLGRGGHGKLGFVDR